MASARNATLDKIRAMPAATNHPVFLQPADTNAKLWRYMDFTKYLWLLESSALYFSRIELLGDPFEGTTTAARNQAVLDMLERAPGSEYKQKEWIEHNARFRQQVRRGLFVNCWHMSTHESEAMWRLYAKTDESIAIQTTYTRLVDAFDEAVLVGAVRYVDYEEAVFPMSHDALWPAVHKRKSFEHEREIRAIKLAMDEGSEPLGHSVSVDLPNLVERVHVSPNSPHWYFPLVEKLTRRFDYEFPITKSRLSEQPVY
jgi:hypothetical protein